MKHTLSTILIVALTVALIHSSVRAELAAAEDARTIATNWIALVEHLKGDWGRAEAAAVSEVREFTRDGRLLGYFCEIQPRGHIVVSLQKNLAPVKAYSSTDYLNPEIDEGMTDLIKLKMEGILTTIEDQLGPIDSLKAGELEAILEIDYADSWTYLDRDVDVFGSELEAGQKINYQEGGVLLETDWDQGDPYNQDCPPPPGGDDCTAPRCAVGCVATAGAQIMRHWHWPPYGVSGVYSDEYDWPNMPGILTGGDPPAEINAIAELCHEIGLDVGMDYCGSAGCQSGAFTEDMIGVYEGQYRYSHSCHKNIRSNNTASEWWDRIVADLNKNRAIHYRVEGHSIACDGWQILPGDVKVYHMNYGWAPDDNTWYALDALPLGGINQEYMLRGIVPDVAIGGYPSSMTYPKETFPYRYLDQDAYGTDVLFEAGQHIQFLPNVTLKGVSPTSGLEIRIESAPSDNTIMFTRGDESMGIRLSGGTLLLANEGAVVFR